MFFLFPGLLQGTETSQSNLFSGSRIIKSIRAGNFDEEQQLFPMAEPGDDFGIDSAFDSTGNVYITGTTFGSLPGYSNAGSYDCFLAKYNTSGVQQWVRQFGSSGMDICTGVGLDTSNNIYIVGYTNGSFPGYTNLGNTDIVLLKYNSTGVQTWVRQLGTAGDDYGQSLVVDSSGRPVFSGFTSGAFSGNTNLGGQDAFISRYTTAGALSFMEQFGTAGDDRALKVNIDSNNRTYLAGTTRGAFAGFTNAGGVDGFVARYNNNGRQAWVQQFGTAGDDYAWGISTIFSSGITNTTGITTGSFAGFTNAGLEDFFLVRYTLNGAQTWLTQGGTNQDDEATSAFSDSSGNTFLSGLTYGSLPGFTNSGEGDFFISKYDTSGSVVWNRQLGTAGDDFFFGSKGETTGRGYYVGGTSDAVAGGTNLNGYDIVVTEYDTSGNQQWIRQLGTN